MGAEYKIITDNHASVLSEKVQKMIDDGWEPIGGHSVVSVHHQMKYAGKQHMQTVIRSEYSQTLIKK